MTVEQLWENFLRWMMIPIAGSDIRVYHVAIALIVVFLFIRITQRTIFRSLDKKAQTIKEMECASCGWKGRLQVSIRRCPQCGQHTMRKQP